MIVGPAKAGTQARTGATPRFFFAHSLSLRGDAKVEYLLSYWP